MAGTALTRGEHRARWAATVTLVVLVLAGAATSARPLPVVVAAVVVAVGLVVILRTAGPRALVVGVGVVCVAVVVLCSGGSTTVGWFASCVLVVVASFGIGFRHAVALGAAWLVVLTANAVVAPDPGWFAWTGGIVMTVFACWSVSRQVALVDELTAAQAGLAARSAAEERARIAREMHDVMGHALTVSLLHISAARLALDDEPEVAASSLAEAERLSRRSLEEVRAAVGVLRDGSSVTTPLPGTADLPDLVAAVARSGVDVTLTAADDLGSLSEVAGLAAYRIVQEALTNVARHAPGATATVHLAVDDRLRLRVDSTVPGAPVGSRRTTGGAGLASMRERAEALGGTLVAGPGGPGWRVEATWPLHAASAASAGPSGPAVPAERARA